MERSLIRITLILACCVITTQQHKRGGAGNQGQGRRAALPAGLDDLGDKLNDFLEKAKDKVRENNRQEGLFARRRKGKQLFSPVHKVAEVLGSSPFAQQLAEAANENFAVIEILKETFKLDNAALRDLLRSKTPVLKPNDEKVSPDQPRIHPSPGECPWPLNTADNFCEADHKYRSYDGSCNNLEKPLWGRAFRPYYRLLPADYADGFHLPRAAKDGSELPSARQVSLTMFKDEDRPSPIYTLMAMTFGQFLDHDITRTAATKLSVDVEGEGEQVDVECGDDGCSTDGFERRACYPIPLAEGDEDFPNMNCLAFVRTQGVVNGECTLSGKEQLNQITSLVDSSNLYGSSIDDANSLRDFSDPSRGRLLVESHPTNPHALPLLPRTQFTNCNDNDEVIQCFRSGDGRINEQVGLASMHTMWQRYHNLIEQKLFDLGNGWDGETFFQESRRLLNAIWQNIIYSEFLPLLLGPDLMQQYNLNVKNSGHFQGYDKTAQPDSGNAFATAAYRYGHSMVRETVPFSNEDYTETETGLLSDYFFRPFELYNDARPGPEGVDSIIFGQISHESASVDCLFTKQISAHLFTPNPPHGIGLDLAALNIQRGRDHGLPDYNVWREFCGLPRANSFDDLAETMSNQETRNKLQSQYSSVDDIDLFAAGLAEDPVEGGMVGPTFACIIGHQFRNSKTGDRFWFENGGTAGSFTADQLDAIRQISMARVICDSLQNVKTIQKYVMLQPIEQAFANLGHRNAQEVYKLASLYKGDNNERRPCSDIQDPDLSAWKV